MKKLFPIAVIGAAVGAAGYFMNKKNKDHVSKTIVALDELGKEAENTVSNLAKDVSDLATEHPYSQE